MVDIEVLKELLQYLISLAEPGAKLVYSLAYKKALFYGYSGLAFGILFLLISIILFINILKLIRDNGNEYNEYFVVLLVFLGVLSFFISIFLFYCSADWFVNTELLAMELILKMLQR